MEPSDISIATGEDAAEIGRILAAGFSDDPVLTWVFGPDRRAEKLGAFFGFLAVEALVPLGATHWIAGCCAAWTPPDPAPWPEERGRRFSEILGAVCPDDDLERLGVLDEATNARHPTEPHWYLGVIATIPERRGAGLGSRVLARSLADVDAAGMPAYLESTNPRNVTLYERAGFVADGAIHLPGGPALTAMWRPAR